MNFTSNAGDRFHYWPTVGDVISAKSWIYKGVRRDEIWIRNTDGREWCWSGHPLSVRATRGQRIAFAWCSVNDQKEEALVAVRNCATDEHDELPEIATCFGLHKYGHRALLWLSASAVLGCGCVYIGVLPGWLIQVPVVAVAVAIVARTLLGFFTSATQDPDPGREIDANVQVALQGIAYAWQTVRNEARSGSLPPTQRQRLKIRGQRKALEASLR